MNTKIIRMKLLSGLTGKAPQEPVDMDTFSPPALWRGEKTTVDVALYADATTVETMTDVSEMKLLISPTPDHATPVVTETATTGGGTLDLTVTDADFLAGTARHATFVVDAAAVVPHMGGQSSVTMYLRVSATWDSKLVILANGAVTVHESGPLS